MTFRTYLYNFGAYLMPSFAKAAFGSSAVVMLDATQPSPRGK
jgi:hypothetical protein